MIQEFYSSLIFSSLLLADLNLADIGSTNENSDSPPDEFSLVRYGTSGQHSCFFRRRCCIRDHSNITQEKAPKHSYRNGPLVAVNFAIFYAAYETGRLVSLVSSL